MKTKRLIALILCILTAVSCFFSAGCGEKADENPADAAVDTGSPETSPEEEGEDEEGEKLLECSVPESLKLNGESVRFLHFFATETFTINIEELTGELLNDAVVNSNQRVMEDLDCVFVHIENGGKNPATLTNARQAGDDVYEIVYGTQWTVAPVVVQHIFANLNRREGTYIDYDKPWWYGHYIREAMADNEHTYFLAGDASPDVFRRSSMLILNTDLLTDIGREVGDIYELVLDGRWTLDRWAEIVRGVYVDSNGDGVRDVKDTYGFASHTGIDVDHFMIDSGVKGCSRDEDGVPYVDFNTPNTVEFVEFFVNLLWYNTGSYGYVEAIPTFEMLENNRVLFLSEQFSRLDQLRNTETNFTVLPLPKLNDFIEHYGSLTHDDANIICIPAISSRIETSSAVLEKLGYYYYYDVMPDYYNVILKTKYRRDSSDAASQVMDLIHDSLTTDFGYFYNYGMGNMMLSLRDLICTQKSTAFTSLYKRNEKIYKKMLENLLESMQEDE